MRIIKFRAWDRDKNKMFNARPVWIMTNGKESIKCFGDAECQVYKHKERFILMQYTGLKDKAGKEIYEGDIIKCKYGKATIESIEDIHQSMGWRDKKENSKCSDIGRTIEKFENEIEIIGNIYEKGE